ncbi:MAG: putative transporter ATP-binding protein [Ilumatobacteraceae bacterium]|nr:putative transporter ATP-binding protein [Ilumatobacteraceae bacterium]
MTIALDGVAASAATPSVLLSGITKRYGSVVACDGVDLALHPGRIHGVLGENGAGKSTLMKILIGLIQPDEGSIAVNGDAVRIGDPVAASNLGLAMVHQHYSLVEPLTVWENVVLGERARLNRDQACTRVAALSDRYGLGVDPLARVSDLTAGQRQRVEIIKCLRREPRIIVFDEPTSVLTPAESEHLFSVLRVVVVDEGRTVALVSHKLDEILHATDEITIMRGGRVVGRSRTSEATASGLAQAVVGRPVSLRSEAAALGLIETVAATISDGDASDAVPQAAAAEAAPVVLEVRNATVLDVDGHALLDDFSITVRAGEIVGLAGVEGNGQRALADMLSSLADLRSGEVLVDGAVVDLGRPGALRRAGIGIIPEDRHDSGCVLDLSVAENLVLTDLHAVSGRGLLDRRAIDRRAAELMLAFEIQARSSAAPMRSLSGGNQQRVVLARELSARPKVLIAAQPTRGLDVGAIEYMSARLRAAAESGVGILLISTELEEVLTLSHRICVIHAGRIVGEMTHHDADLERLGLLIGGVAA